MPREDAHQSIITFFDTYLSSHLFACTEIFSVLEEVITTEEIMAAQLQLTSKATGKPVDLVALDAEICRHMNVPVHDTKWCYGWMDTVGFLLAYWGNDFRESMLEGYFYEKELIEIYKFIMKDHSNTSYGVR